MTAWRRALAWGASGLPCVPRARPCLGKKSAHHLAGMAMEEKKRTSPAPAWLLAVFGCAFVAGLLVVAAVLHWPVPWWAYAVVFPLCLLMPPWVPSRVRRDAG